MKFQICSRMVKIVDFLRIRMLSWLVLHLAIILELFPLVFSECSHLEFFSKKTLNCEPCTKCQNYTVVISPCTNSSDTRCGLHRDISHDFHWLKGVKPPEESPIETVTKSDSEHWKKLAFSLIGALCTLAVIATVVVFISCRKYKYLHCTSEKYNNDRTDLDLRGDNEGESEYVVIRRQPCSIVYNTVEIPHPLSGVPHVHQGRYQRLRRIYRPQRRLMNEYVDDVFESEDSGGSRSGVRLPLHTIPERSDSEGRET